MINLSKKAEHRNTIIDGDGSGYYSWLPSIFINKTLDFNLAFQAEKLRKGKDYQGHNYHETNGILINKFPPGTAFFILPFFLSAYLISSILGLALDGYGSLFQYSVGIAAVFWCWLGLIYVFKVLNTYKLTSLQSSIFTLAALFASNLFAYTFLMPSFSHVYSFAAISIFVYHAKKYFDNHEAKHLWIAALILGTIITIRSVNILIILMIPFLAGSLKNLNISLLSKQCLKNILKAIILFLIGLIPLLLINYLQTGNPIIYSYKNEGFYWNNPEILNFLFSFRKGWFVYSPLFLILFPAIFYIYKKSKFQFFAFLGFFAILVYIFSSWWNWFYGDSFGMRPMIDFTIVFILIIALFYKHLKPVYKRIILAFISLAIILNLIQSYQYAKGIIHPDSMNREAYFKVFLKTSSKYKGTISGGPEYFYGKLNSEPFLKETNDFETLELKWSQPKNLNIDIFYSGKTSLKLDSDNIYSSSFNWLIPDSLSGRKNLYVKISSQIYETIENSAASALFIMDIQNSDRETIFYKKAKLKQMPDENVNKWEDLKTAFKLPYLEGGNFLIKIYIWNKEKMEFYVDDFKLEFYEYN